MGMLRCPNCQGKIVLEENGATCRNGHHFDRAKQGYYNLLIGHTKKGGDNKTMSQARHRFLSSGHYLFLLKKVNEVFADRSTIIVDLGCGEGYYSRQLNHSVIGFDLSKESLKIASRRDPNNTYIVASIADLPLMDESVGTILKMFTPTYESEIVRILKPGGIALVVDVGPRHLLEMKKVLYDEVHLNKDSQLQQLTLINNWVISKQTKLTKAELIDLVAMTPYQYKTHPDDLKRLSMLENLLVTFEFKLKLYTR